MEIAETKTLSKCRGKTENPTTKPAKEQTRIADCNDNDDNRHTQKR